MMRQVNEERVIAQGRTLAAFAAVTALCFGSVGCGGSGGSGGGSGSVAAGSTVSAQNIGGFQGLEVYPAQPLTVDNDINSGFQIAVDGRHSAATIDVTRDSTYAVADDTVAVISGDGYITPVGPGTTDITVEYRGRTATVNVTVVPPTTGPTNMVSMHIHPPFRNMPRVAPAQGLEDYQQLVVTATDGQGRLWDLTRTAGIGVYDGNNQPTQNAKVSTTGLLRAVMTGEVIAVSRVASAGLIFGARFILGDGVDATPVDPNSLYSGEPLASSMNPVDQAVADGLFGQLIEPAPLAEDGEFLRRLYSDAIGRTPTEAEYMAFTSSTATDKREQEVDKVLADPAFAAKWAGHMGEWFEMQRSNNMGANANAFDAWAEAGIAAGDTLADMVTELATGGVPSFETQHDNAAKKVDILILSGTGMTSQCAVCHDHPLTGPTDTIVWNQVQRYGLDAFFATNNSEAIPLDKDGVRSGNGGQPVQPGWVFDANATVQSTLADPVANRRAEFAALLTGSTVFNRGMGHRIFASVCGELLNPNQFLDKELATVMVPQVLDALAATFSADSSLKGFLKTLFSSKYYQLTSAAADESADDYLARRTLRRQDGEVVDNCLDEVTGMANTNRGFLRQVFGVPENRESVAERVGDINMSQAFLLMNSPIVQGRVTGNGTVAQLAAQVTSNQITAEDAVKSLFRVTLSREPEAGELAECLAVVTAAGNARQGLEDVSAVLISTTEFLLD